MSRFSDEALRDLVHRNAPELRDYLEAYPDEQERVEKLRGTLRPLKPKGPAAPQGLPESIGPYTVIRVLGEGGMGLVYEARQRNPDRLVALKVKNPGLNEELAEELFHRETLALARLVHPAIATIYDCGSTPEGARYLAMELVRGERLDRYVVREELSIPARLQLFRQVCDGVQYAHEQGVIHRDLKPLNILVDPKAGPKILDFGIARVSAGQSTVARSPGGNKIGTLTGRGSPLGTLAYMSPEQLSGQGKVSARSDVYSLGIILFELLTGEQPHDLRSLSFWEIVKEIRDRPIPRPSLRDTQLRGDLDTIVLKAADRDPDQRYATVQELSEDVRRYLVNEPVRARPVALGYRIRKFCRRHWFGLTASIALVVLLLFTAFVSAFRVSFLNTVTGQWFASKVPYSAMRWQGDKPDVLIRGDWYRLLRVESFHIDYVIGYAKEQTGPWLWRKRCMEDLLELVNRLGCWSTSSMDLEVLDLKTNGVRRLDGVPLREDYRDSIYVDRMGWPFDVVETTTSHMLVLNRAEVQELVSVDGIPAQKLIDTVHRLGFQSPTSEFRYPRFRFYDVVTEAAGQSPGDRLSFVTRDRTTGEQRAHECASRREIYAYRLGLPLCLHGIEEGRMLVHLRGVDVGHQDKLFPQHRAARRVATWELVSFDGIPAEQLARGLEAIQFSPGHKCGFWPWYHDSLHDLILKASSRQPARTIRFVLRDRTTGREEGHEYVRHGLSWLRQR